MIYKKTKKRIWPTLLCSAGEAANRSLTAKHPRGGDVHTAIIMSRTSFDAYLHELIILRELERYVKFGEQRGSKRDAAGNRWRTIEERYLSIPTASKGDREFRDINKMDFDEKLQTIVTLLLVDQSLRECVDAGSRFKELFWLNRVRNAIIHHDYGQRTDNLMKACRSIAAAAGAPIPEQELPWEELLTCGNVAVWACRITAKAILEIESFQRNRRIHYESTKDVVLSAISSLEIHA